MTLAGISAARHPTNLVGLALGPHTGLRNPGLTGVGIDAEDRDDNRFRGDGKVRGLLAESGEGTKLLG